MYILEMVSISATSQLEQQHTNYDNDNLRYWLCTLFNGKSVSSEFDLSFYMTFIAILKAITDCLPQILKIN